MSLQQFPVEWPPKTRKGRNMICITDSAKPLIQSKVIRPTTRQKQHYWAIYVRYNLTESNKLRLASVAIGRTEVCSWVFTRTLTRPSRHGSQTRTKLWNALHDASVVDSGKTSLSGQQTLYAAVWKQPTCDLSGQAALIQK